MPKYSVDYKICTNAQMSYLYIYLRITSLASVILFTIFFIIFPYVTASPIYCNYRPTYMTYDTIIPRPSFILGPFVLTWIDWNSSMDMLFNQLKVVGWNNLSIPKLQQSTHWHSWMEKGNVIPYFVGHLIYVGIEVNPLVKGALEVTFIWNKDTMTCIFLLKSKHICM